MKRENEAQGFTIGEAATPLEAVAYCASAAREAMQAAMEADEEIELDELRACGRHAFLGCMPLLGSLEGCRAYIACCAAGVQMSVFDAQEAAKLMYLAQTAMTAWRKGGR